MSDDVYNEMLRRLGETKADLTVISAYLQCQNKNPTDFIVLLKRAFDENALAVDEPDKILDGLAATWTECTNKDPKLVVEPYVPSHPPRSITEHTRHVGHIFICAIHEQPDLWNAELKRGNALQTSSAAQGRPSCDA